MGPLSSLSGVGVWERGREAGDKNKGNVERKSAYGLLFVGAFQTKVNCRCVCVCVTSLTCAFNKLGRLAFVH